MSVSVNDKNIGHVTAYAYAKAKGYTGTEEEFAQLMADYGSVAQAAAQSASEAAQSAQDAAGSSTEATAAKTAAETARTDAQAARDGAQTAEAGAQAARTGAETAQSRAESARTGAETARTQAAGSAEAASTSANNASASETAAAASATAAQTAQTGAETAQTAAETAQGRAESAAESIAESVEQITTNTADIAALKTDYPQTKAAAYAAYATDTVQGEITSFPDGADNVPVKSLTVNIEPVQDLHGQESPYPAGGGKNLFDINNLLITAATTAYITTYAPKVENGKFYNGGKAGESVGASYAVPVKAGSTYTVQFIVGGETVKWEARAVTLNGNVWASNAILASAQTDVFGAVSFTVTIPSGYTHLFVGCYSATKQGSWETNIQIEEGSTATDYAPYSNICPISGHTQAVVTRTGKNLIDPSVKQATSQSVAQWYSDGYTLRAGRTYTLSSNAAGTTVYFSALDNSSIASGAPSATFTPIEDTVCKFRAYLQSGVADVELQLEFGSTATPYEPYHEQTYTIDLNGTRYGGSLDVLTGVLTVDRAMVDLGTLTYSYIDSTKYFFTSELYGKKKPGRENWISSMYRLNNSAFANMPNYSAKGNVDAGGMYFKNLDYDDAASFKTAMDGVQLAYELAKPFAVQLTANDIKTLLGTNNIWSDAGDVDVTYRADTRLYIDKRINEAVSALS